MKITYLFGAGASAEALPVVSEIPKRIKYITVLLESPIYYYGHKIYKLPNLDPISIEQIKKGFIEELKWLYEVAENHASIDTFAKKLYIKGNHKELEILKTAFSTYLVIEQILNKYDKRYDSLYASILTDSYSSFPQNVRILSWNYDFQFEKAYAEYYIDSRTSSIDSILNIYNKYNRKRVIDSGFAIVKLNGTAKICNGILQSSHFISDYNMSSLNDSIEEALKNYHLIKISTKKVFAGLSFAWEKFSREDADIISCSKDLTKDTKVLVVIGYSFPYFNRDVDIDIIKNMKDLQKVYFQAPDASDIRERFLSVRNDIPMERLLVRTNTKQFLLPNEL